MSPARRPGRRHPSQERIRPDRRDRQGRGADSGRGHRCRGRRRIVRRDGGARRRSKARPWCATRGPAARPRRWRPAPRPSASSRPNAAPLRRSPAGPHHLLFLDADLGETAAHAGPLAEPVRAGLADMTIAVFASKVKLGGHGLVVGLSGTGIERATGWRPAEPLNGQRCLTRARVRGGAAARAGLGCRNRPHHRPAAQGHADHRSTGAAGAPGHRRRPALAGAQGQATGRRRQGAGDPQALATGSAAPRRAADRAGGPRVMAAAGKVRLPRAPRHVLRTGRQRPAPGRGVRGGRVRVDRGHPRRGGTRATRTVRWCRSRARSRAA